MPFLFLFFFHQSSLYPIKIFAKSFYLLVMVVLQLHHGLVKIMLRYVGHWPILYATESTAGESLVSNKAKRYD